MRRVLVSALLMSSAGCGARTGLFEPPPPVDASVDGADGTIVDGSGDVAGDTDVVTDTAPDVVVVPDASSDAFDATDALDAADSSADVPDAPPIIVELALLVSDSPGSTSLVLADGKTGAILRRGPRVPGVTGPLVSISPDSHHAIAGMGPLTRELARFDVATTFGSRFAALVNHFEWSHDSQHLCLATADGPFIARFDATDGGSRIALPPDGDTLVADTCAWSHDDSAVVWQFGPRLYVTPADGGPSTEIARASATVDRLQLGPWSPTEQRLPFALHDTVTGWRVFTGGVSFPRVALDDGLLDWPYFPPTPIGWSSDGSQLAYVHLTDWPPNSSIRRAPTVGPFGSGIELAASRKGTLGGFRMSPSATWFVYGADAPIGYDGALVVTSMTGKGTIALPALKPARASWSSRDVLTFVDGAVGGGVFVVTPDATSTPTRVGAPLLSGEEIADVAWSPDGSALAYARASGDGGSGPGSLCVFELATLSNRCTPPYLDAMDPQWSSDGASIAFRSGGDIYVTSPSSLADARRVAVTPFETTANWWVRP